MQNAATRHDPLPPIDETITLWFNPLSVDQIVIVRHGNEARPTRYVFKPGRETPVPARFDDAIQKVHCDQDECRTHAPGFCRNRKEHQGTVLGGLAPQLRYVGSPAKLSEALDPALAAKRQAEAEVAAADIARRVAADAQIIAEQKRLEAAAKLDEQAKVEEKAAEEKAAKTHAKK
jgi:hypothetical protein